MEVKMKEVIDIALIYINIPTWKNTHKTFERILVTLMTKKWNIKNPNINVINLIQVSYRGKAYCVIVLFLRMETKLILSNISFPV